VYEIRDPIHRSIWVSEDERRVLDHPWVQRLRHIRQLGFVSMVYPGAVHDRFQHSVGVMHLAGSLFEGLMRDHRQALSDFGKNDLTYAWQVLRFAGLCHDLGHAPFSHTAEAFLPGVERFRLPENWYRQGQAPAGRRASHEDCTLGLIAGLAAEGAMDPLLARDVAAVLSPAVRRGPRLGALGPLVAILRGLVSGEVDADRGDYLLRDSHYTGVSYGVYDLPRLSACLAVLPGAKGPELGLDVHGVHAFESVLLARYHMFLQVYFHKTPPAFEYFLQKAVDAGEVTFSINGLDELVELRDDSIVSQLHRARAEGGQWSRRILDREPAKLVLRERTGADHQENFLAGQLVNALEEAGCHVFVRRSRQSFTKIADAGGGDGSQGAELRCVRRILGRPMVDSVTRHSDLLSAFNAPIDLQHTYVLREDADRASQVIDRLGEWQ
jgi:HD superfamily phosphohydrolase